VNGTISYALDPVGNRLSDTSNLGPVGSFSTTYNADDQSQAETSDAFGDTTATGGKTYAYNSWLKLVSMNGGQVTLAYNGLGQLEAKSTGGVTTQYLTDDLSPTGYPQVVAELVNGTPVRTYTYGLERVSQLQTVNNTPTVSFYQYDGRGTVRLLTDLVGTVTDTYEYDAFGNQISHTGTTPNPYLYRGERYDADLGLYYLRARWYNPATGRFMTRDPYQGSIYDPASLHRYNYARANPANFIDPSGRFATGEYGKLTFTDIVKNAAAVTALGAVVRCSIYTIASSVQLLGENPGWHLENYGANWRDCWARTTWSQLGKEFLINGASFGLGYAAGPALEALGGWLGYAEQGSGLAPEVSQFSVRSARMLENNVGYNVSPESWFSQYPTLGSNGTFVTDAQALQDLGISPTNGAYKVGLFDDIGTVSADNAANLEKGLGLQPGSLLNGFRVTEVDGLQSLSPASPLTGNNLFLGPGAGLPGGGPEMIVQPIPTSPWPTVGP